MEVIKILEQESEIVKVEFWPGSMLSVLCPSWEGISCTLAKGGKKFLVI